MGKSSKVKSNKVPTIGEKEYAEYINFLKNSVNDCETQESVERRKTQADALGYELKTEKDVNSD